MANYKDNNADLGSQMIEGTESPYTLEAEIVMPDDEPVIILAEPVDEHAETVVTPNEEPEPIIALAPDDPIITPAADEPIVTPIAEDPIVTPSPEQADDLDAQLAAMLGEEQPTETEKESEPVQNADDLDAQLAAMLGEEQPTATENENEPIQDADDLDAQLAAMLGEEQPEPEQEAKPVPEEPVETVNEQAVPDEQTTQQSSGADDAARAMLEQAQAIMEQARQAQMQAAVIQAQAQQQVQQTRQAPPPQQSEDKAADAARSMLQQAQMMMQQAQAAQLQAQQAAQQAQIHAQAAASPVRRSGDSETEAARMMMEQAKRLMEQAQSAQIQAQQAQMHATSPYGATDPYALKEVDRLKNELDGMRELVNKLTLAMSQSANSSNHATTGQPYYGPDRDKYRELESELEKMRRDMMEKDLRDREKELDRRQKEAETVRDIRPEMMQMSDSRDMVPVAQQQQNIGNEYIPIANGVYYSTKDKQVYVMTPASGAASANPTIERPKTAPARRPATRRPARPVHRRPSGRRPAPRRPHR